MKFFNSSGASGTASSSSNNAKDESYSSTPSEKSSNLLHIRVFVLILLCLQNSGHALVARYSQVSCFLMHPLFLICYDR
jgi:hypothetical protein